MEKNKNEVYKNKNNIKPKTSPKENIEPASQNRQDIIEKKELEYQDILDISKLMQKKEIREKFLNFLNENPDIKSKFEIEFEKEISNISKNPFGKNSGNNALIIQSYGVIFLNIDPAELDNIVPVFGKKTTTILRYWQKKEGKKINETGQYIDKDIFDKLLNLKKNIFEGKNEIPDSTQQKQIEQPPASSPIVETPIEDKKPTIEEPAQNKIIEQTQEEPTLWDNIKDFFIGGGDESNKTNNETVPPMVQNNPIPSYQPKTDENLFQSDNIKTNNETVPPMVQNNPVPPYQPNFDKNLFPSEPQKTTTEKTPPASSPIVETPIEDKKPTIEYIKSPDKGNYKKILNFINREKPEQSSDNLINGLLKNTVLSEDLIDFLIKKDKLNLLSPKTNEIIKKLGGDVKIPNFNSEEIETLKIKWLYILKIIEKFNSGEEVWGNKIDTTFRVQNVEISTIIKISLIDVIKNI